MAVGAADIRRSLITLWNENDLDSGFKEWWLDSEKEDFTVFFTDVASPHQPSPYCVLHFKEAVKSVLMTSNPNFREVREVQVGFRAYSDNIPIRDTPVEDGLLGDIIGSESAGSVLSSQIEEIMKVFGGHPTVSPQIPVLSNGNTLQLQYLNDFFRKTKASESDKSGVWELNYEVMVDVPMV